MLAILVVDRMVRKPLLVFAVLGLLFILMVVPETKGKSLEELEEMLVK